MTVILADVLGYCMGVRRAVESAIASIDKANDVYTLGPLIHNKTALNSLENKGLKVLNENKAEDAKIGSTVIIRAHGVPPSVNEILKKRECTIINATCPRVTASQKNAARYASMNYTVILAGDSNHGEVIGIAGYAGNKFYLVQDSEDAKKLLPPEDADENAILLSQTTFSPQEFEKIAKIIKEKYKNLKVMNTICPATKERQDSLLRLCPLVEGVLVVGGKNSANTKRLLQTAKENCSKAALIESADEIPEDFFKLQIVGITAGASTPDSAIEEVKNALTSHDKS
ncbi:MAG: 4-hydroxy-3-methylbut-2-enyl diphosphate reductase [Treponema sp.]